MYQGMTSRLGHVPNCNSQDMLDVGRGMGTQHPVGLLRESVCRHSVVSDVSDANSVGRV